VRNDREKWTRVRIRFVGGLFALCLAITAARAFYLQVSQHERLTKLAEKQHLKTVPLTPARGTIADRNNAPLAVSIEMDSCFAEPRSMDDIHGTAAKLAPLLGMTRPELEQKLKSARNFVWLQRRITPDLAKQIKELELDGIGFIKETKRFYPNAEIAGHVIGFTGVDPEGLEGVERRYDTVLLGNNGYLITERDALGRDIALRGTVVKSASKGYNLSLTLDKNIQYLAEKELVKAVETSRAKGGIAIVMEPQTGKILAMANAPSFNPNAYGRYPAQVLRNRAVADSFEPGSTMKVFLIASALEEKVISPGDGFNCEGGNYAIGGRTIHDTHKYGRLSVADILKYSSNIGAAKIGARMGSERLYRYLRGFGFGERSAIDLPAEASGYLRNSSSWYGIDLATISFGQGVSVTAVQLAAAFSAVANGGTLMKPYLVEKVLDDNGDVVKEYAPEPRQRVISEQTAKTVARMMEGVAAEGGTGTSAAVEGFRVAGKTGTAQKVDPVTRGYSIDKRTASFIGFVPADRPRLTIVVIVDEPKTSPYGGVVAAPAFGAIAQQALCYLRVQPDRTERKQPQRIEVKQQQPAQTVADAAEGSITDASEGGVMVNFRGMSMRQVLQVMEKKGLNVKVLGSGRVVEQNPAAGQKIGPNEPVWVRLVPAA
jgi:cell division protein FtsI (penicillin-binding protein 3)